MTFEGEGGEPNSVPFTKNTKLSKSKQMELKPCPTLPGKKVTNAFQKKEVTIKISKSKHQKYFSGEDKTYSYQERISIHHICLNITPVFLDSVCKLWDLNHLEQFTALLLTSVLDSSHISGNSVFTEINFLN